MNFVIARTSQIPLANRPVRLMPLTWLLNELGVPKTIVGRDSHRIWGRGSNTKARLPHGYWHDIFDHAKRRYRAQMLTLHPDRGGCHDKCARINAVFTMIRKRIEPLLE